MHTLSPTEARAFLLAQARTAKLATVRADGRPHVAPVWFDLDGDVLLFTTWHASVKGSNLRRDPRVSLCVDDEVPPFAFMPALVPAAAPGGRSRRRWPSVGWPPRPSRWRRSATGSACRGLVSGSSGGGKCGTGSPRAMACKAMCNRSLSAGALASSTAAVWPGAVARNWLGS
jgi:hypothetical protein